MNISIDESSDMEDVFSIPDGFESDFLNDIDVSDGELATFKKGGKFGEVNLKGVSILAAGMKVDDDATVQKMENDVESLPSGSLTQNKPLLSDQRSETTELPLPKEKLPEKLTASQKRRRQRKKMQAGGLDNPKASTSAGETSSTSSKTAGSSEKTFLNPRKNISEIRDRLVSKNSLMASGKRKPNSPLTADGPKKPKTYADILKASLRVNISNYADDGAVFSELQYKLILKLLLKKLDSAEKPIPHFEMQGFNKLGTIWINCSDKYSQDWIIAKIPEIAADPLVNHLVIRARVDASANYARFGVVFPYEEDDPETKQQILARLRRCNEGLDTSLWTQLSNSKPTNKGWFFLLGIDDESVKFLKNKDMRLHYAFTRLLFRQQKVKCIDADA